MSAISQKMLTATFPLKHLQSTRWSHNDNSVMFKIFLNQMPFFSNRISRNHILQVSSGSYIYMTFDDGPNEGTPYVLDALKEVQID